MEYFIDWDKSSMQLIKGLGSMETERRWYSEQEIVVFLLHAPIFPK